MITQFVVRPEGRFRGPDLDFACALGRGGVIDAAAKQEGDGATPAGLWPMRRVFYRPDRIAAPETGLDRVPLRPHDGWCDDPRDPLYNRPVSLPYAASHERLWRDEPVYDVIVELGYNDEPVEPGRGSAIFMHVARADGAPTEGCVALALADLLDVLRLSGPDSLLQIEL